LVDVLDVIKEYKDKGYNGIVFTDHIADWSFSALNGTWEEKIDFFYSSFDKAKKVGEELGLKIFCGMEICLGIPGRDYLAYGFNREFLYDHDYVYKMNVEEFYGLAQENNILLVAAHPFRYKGHTPDARYMHCVEVFNGNPRHDSNNKKAKTWASQNKLIQLAGSDFHEYGDVSAGILMATMPETIEEFVEIIRSDNYELVY
jgi:hypothetical protein